MNQNRVPQGVPTGGQFATTSHGESEVALSNLEDLTDAYLDAFDSDDENAEDQSLVHAAIQQAYASALHHERQKGFTKRSRGVLDVDDVAQETLLQTLERQANGHVIEDPKGYMHKTAWGIASQAGNGAVRSEDRRALRLFNEAREKQSAGLGRALTGEEQDEIAASIRDNWHDQRHKPSKDFRRYAGQMEVSYDAAESPEAASVLLPNSVMGRPGEVDEFEVRPGSFTEKALDAVNGTNGDLRHAKQCLWNSLAENSDAPVVQPGTMSVRKVTAMRAVMRDYSGGVEGAIRAWENGEDNEATAALFSAWDNQLTIVEEQAVVNQMRRVAGEAEAMWISTLQLANNRNKGRF